jgi:hypothetical protein
LSPAVPFLLGPLPTPLLQAKEAAALAAAQEAKAAAHAQRVAERRAKYVRHWQGLVLVAVIADAVQRAADAAAAARVKLLAVARAAAAMLRRQWRHL